MNHLDHYDILLVEDEPDDIFLLLRAFKKVNLANSVHVVKDGEEAVLYLSGQGIYSDRQKYPLPMLILLDLKLPRRSGLEVLEWLRQQPMLKRLPVVVLTSSREDSDLNRAYDLGVNSYLVKPVAFDGLINMVKQLNYYWVLLNEKPAVEDS